MAGTATVSHLALECAAGRPGRDGHPYYERFLARFTDVKSLAGAPLDDGSACGAAWGYYSGATCSGAQAVAESTAAGFRAHEQGARVRCREWAAHAAAIAVRLREREAILTKFSACSASFRRARYPGDKRVEIACGDRRVAAAREGLERYTRRCGLAQGLYSGRRRARPAPRASRGPLRRWSVSAGVAQARAAPRNGEVLLLAEAKYCWRSVRRSDMAGCGVSRKFPRIRSARLLQTAIGARLQRTGPALLRHGSPISPWISRRSSPVASASPCASEPGSLAPLEERHRRRTRAVRKCSFSAGGFSGGETAAFQKSLQDGKPARLSSSSTASAGARGTGRISVRRYPTTGVFEACRFGEKWPP